MTRQEKMATIEELQSKFEQHEFFYVTDSSTLTVKEVNKLRGLCYEKGIEMRVVKNSLARKALEAADEAKGYAPLYDAFTGPTAIMFTQISNAPAKMIKEFRETHEKPILKAAYIDTDVFIGDDQLDILADLKSKEELIGEVIGLLQSPMKNLISALQSGGNTLSGLLKALEQRTDTEAPATSETPAIEETPAAEVQEEDTTVVVEESPGDVEEPVTEEENPVAEMADTDTVEQSAEEADDAEQAPSNETDDANN